MEVAKDVASRKDVVHLGNTSWIHGLAHLFREWDHRSTRRLRAGVVPRPILFVLVDTFVEPFWAACGLRGLQSASCACHALSEAIGLFMRMQTRLEILSEEITRTTCWYAISRCRNLHTLSVGGREWSVSHLTTAPKLVFADVLAAETALVLAPFVAANPALELLTVTCADGRRAQLSGAWLRELRGTGTGTRRQNIRLPSSPIGYANDSCDLTAIFAAAHLAHNDSATGLSAWDSGVSDAGVGALSVYLYANQSLRTLNLSQNAIGDEGAALLVRALRRHPSLETLVLQHNRIGEDGGVELGALLATNTQLRELELWGNALGCAGTVGLARGLGAGRFNSALQTLDLRANRVGDDGAAALGVALGCNRSLLRLLLSWNQVGDAGAEALAGGLRGNCTLDELNLLENYVGDTGASALREAVGAGRRQAERSQAGQRHNTALRCCILQANRVHESAIVADLEAWLAAKPS